MIIAVLDCAIITALYGAEAWCQGLARIPTWRDEEVGWYIDLLNRIMLKSGRATLSPCRTTSTLTL